jgi:hypothetical protein
MAVNHINVFERRHPLEIDIQGLQDFLEAFVSGIVFELLAKADSANVVRIVVLRAKAAGLDVAELGEFLTEELDVNTCATIDFWWKLIGKNCSVHSIVNSV